MKSIDGGIDHQRRISDVQLRNWKSLKGYLLLLLELKWIESFEREESTPFNWLKPGPLRHWKTRYFRLTPLGREFLELFPKDLARSKIVPVAEDEDLASPEEQAANWEAFKRGEWNLPTGEV
ncbi:MAG: hypothetical protein PXY39_02150 [archaeon]|nr:hypothetical protein [archaeon]